MREKGDAYRGSSTDEQRPTCHSLIGAVETFCCYLSSSHTPQSEAQQAITNSPFASRSASRSQLPPLFSIFSSPPRRQNGETLGG